MEEKSTVVSKLNKLAVRSKLYPDQIIDRELYSLVYNPEMLIYAYENIKSKSGNMTLGIAAAGPETLYGIFKSEVENLSESLKSERFAFTPSRIIKIPKGLGVTKPLSIALPRDKIVQEAMRLVLEAIYEPLFKDCSHGFRPNKGCHTALKQASQEFQPVQ